MDTKNYVNIFTDGSKCLFEKKKLFTWMIFFCNGESLFPKLEYMRCRNIYLVLSVFPEPDSPLTIIA